MPPSPPTSTGHAALPLSCPWCSRELVEQPRDGNCPHCGQPCDDRVFAIDVFEGKSRPRLVLAIAGWFFVLLTGAVVVNGVFGRGPTGDVVIFGLFFVVLLMIAAAETHGLWLMRKGTGSRRLIFTTEGVEVINTHRVTGISSAAWDEIDRVEVDAGKGGGVHVKVFTPHAAKATIRVVSATRTISPEQVRYEIDRLRVAVTE